jgi:hypothetical protein
VPAGWCRRSDRVLCGTDGRCGRSWGTTGIDSSGGPRTRPRRRGLAPLRSSDPGHDLPDERAVRKLVRAHGPSQRVRPTRHQVVPQAAHGLDGDAALAVAEGGARPPGAAVDHRLQRDRHRRVVTHRRSRRVPVRPGPVTPGRGETAAVRVDRRVQVGDRQAREVLPGEGAALQVLRHGAGAHRQGHPSSVAHPLDRLGDRCVDLCGERTGHERSDQLVGRLPVTVTRPGQGRVHPEVSHHPVPCRGGQGCAGHESGSVLDRPAGEPGEGRELGAGDGGIDGVVVPGPDHDRHRPSLVQRRRSVRRSGSYLPHCCPIVSRNGGRDGD